MDDKVAQLILDELFSSLEIVETQSAAILQFLRDKGIASDDELARCIEQAGMAISVKRRAARVRIDFLLSGITNPPRKPVESDAAKSEDTAQASTTNKEAEKHKEKEAEKAHGVDERADKQKDQGKDSSGQEASTSKAEKNSRAGEDSSDKARQEEKEPKKEGVARTGDEEKKPEQTEPGATTHQMDEKAKSESDRKPAATSSDK
jgi:hypothetical protein